MKITDIITEAANPAQQAAIAISMKKAGKKPKTEGMAEGSLNELSKDTLKSYAKKAIPDMQASQKRSEIEAGKAASTKDDETAKTHYDAAKQASDRTEKRMAGISGAIKRVTKQGVAEGSLEEDEYDKMLRDLLKARPDLTKKYAKDVQKSKDIESGKELNKLVKKNPGVLKTYSDAVKRDKKLGVAEGSESDAYGNTGEKHECGSCDGTGIVSYDELAKAVEYDDECPECGGKGWVRDKESFKKKGMAEHTELAEEFDLIESIVEMIAEHNGVDADVVWADLESLTEDELYVFAVTSDPLMESEAWQKANKRDRTDGMSQKAVNTYRREHPGSKLKTAVTTKPSKLKKGSKASKRRKSYCSRSRGQMKMHSISCAKTPDKAICKARRRWNC